MSKPLLQFVHEYVDRHGHPRRYFRRRGYKKIPLPGVPGSEEYMAAYARALAEAQPAPVGMKRSKTGTLGAAITGYLASGAFVALAPSSQHARRLILEKLARDHGDLPIAGIASRHIVMLLDTKAGKPGAALNLLAALRVLLRYSVAVGLRADDPTVGVRGPKLRVGGHYPWSEDDIARFEQRHALGTTARLALALLVYTGQRRTDVLALGRQHVRDGLIHLRQTKTGKVLAIPVHPELQAVLDATPADNLTFLVSRNGRPYAADSFTHWFKKKCREAGVTAEASPHGLRKAACRRLAEAGCSASVIASISGHKSLREVQRYVESADQIHLARQGIKAVTRTKVATRDEG